MEEDTGGNPSTSADIVKREDDSPPPNLTASDDGDDGYPNTPPVLERQDYYMENDDPEPEPSIIKKKPIVDKWYSFEDTEFYIPPDLRHLNPCKYSTHSPLLVLDLICILCQRVCNETYAVSCLCNHRFCKDCILPRYKKHKYCPRCGAELGEEPRPDETYDFIIELMQFDKDLVNYVNLEPESERRALADSSSSEDDSDCEDYKSEDRRPTPRSSKMTIEQIINHEKNVGNRVADLRKKYKFDEINYGPEDDEAKRRRKRLNRMVIPPFETPPYSYMTVHEQKEGTDEAKKNLLIEQTKGQKPDKNLTDQDWKKLQDQESYLKYSERWSKTNLSKPLQNMVYKTFWFNKDVDWPENRPPTPPCGLTLARLRDVKLANKARKYFWADPFLSKREKKISIHQFLTNDLEEPYDILPFASSSDDDDPPPQFCPYKFEYPDKYRKPRKDWRRLFDAEGNPKRPLPKTRSSGTVKHKRKLPFKWKKEYGEPTMLIRESSIKSSVTFKEMQRFYTGVPNNAKVGHIQSYVHKKLSVVKNLKLELVPKRFLVEFYLVTYSAPANKINVIRCDKTELLATKPQSASSQQSKSPPMAITLQSELPQNRTASPVKEINGYTSEGAREPTVREIALQKMEQEKKKARMERMKRHPYNKRNYPVSPEYRYRPRQLRAFTVEDPVEVQTPVAPGPSTSSAPNTQMIATASVSTPTTPTQALLKSPTPAVPLKSPAASASLKSPAQPKAASPMKPATLAPAPYMLKSSIPPPRLRPLPPNTQLTPTKGPPKLTANLPQTNGSSPSAIKEALKPSTSATVPAKVSSAPRPSSSASEKNPELVSILNNPSKFISDRRLSNPLPAAPKVVLPKPPKLEPMRMMPPPKLTPNGGMFPVNTRFVPSQQGAMMRCPPNMGRVQTMGAIINPMPGQMVAYQQPMKPVGQPNHFPGMHFSTPTSNGDDVIILPMTGPSGHDVTYLQITSEGLVPCQNLGNGIVGITPPKTNPGPTYLQPLSTPTGGTYFQSYHPVAPAEQPIPQTPQAPSAVAEPPKLQQPRGIGKGSLLPKNMTAYVTDYPLRSLDLQTEVKELRKRNKLRKGCRLCLFYSIRDLKCEEVPVLPPPIAYPPLASVVRRSNRRKRFSTDSVPRKEE